MRPPLSRPLMSIGPVRLGLAVTLPMLGWVAAAHGEAQDGLQACRSIGADAERLACFDREAARLAPPRFSGRLGFVTAPIEIESSTTLRFQSDGAIFVLYLKTADGSVLQNLHIGGGGEATYLIEHPGTYVLDINGSKSWRIWLEPANPIHIN